MITFIVYTIIGLLSAFSGLIISKLDEWNDDTATILYSIAMLVVWPIAIPVTIIVWICRSLDSWAEAAAQRIKQRKN